MRCLASAGKLLELGKYDMMIGTQLPIEPLMKNIEYLGVDLDQILTAGDSNEVWPKIPPTQILQQQSSL